MNFLLTIFSFFISLNLTSNVWHNFYYCSLSIFNFWIILAKLKQLLRVSFAHKDGKDYVVPSMVVHKFSETIYNSEKGRWIREGGRTRSSNDDGDPRLARGTDQGPSSVCEGLWRAWLNLIIVVSRAHAHKSVRVVWYTCSRECAYEPRVGSAKSQQLTHIRGELNILISSGTLEWLFSTLRGVEVRIRVCASERLRLCGDCTLKIEADGDEFRYSDPNS